MFSKEEIKDLAISILLLGFVFGFDDGRKEFVAKLWFLNLLKIILLVIIAVLFREFVIKLYARRHQAKSYYKFWLIKRFWFTNWGKTKVGMPLAQLFALLGAIISEGKFFFTAIGTHKLEENRVARTGRKHTLLTYSEEGRIVLAGIFANLFLMFLSSVLVSNLNLNLVSFIKINFSIAIWNLLPIGSLDGAKIFFGSKLLWIFSVLFGLISFIFLEAGTIVAIIGAFLLAIMGVALYYYKYEA